MQYTHTIQNLPKSVVEATVSIPKETVTEFYDEAFTQLSKELEVEGFRKGKAPKKIAEKHIQKDKIYDRLVRELLSKIYEDIIKKESLQPVVSPKVDLKSAKENEPWEVAFQIAQKPQIDLGDYKEHVKALKASQKSKDIWVPGKEEPKKEDEQVAAMKKQKFTNDILSEILKHVKVEVADIIVQEELDGRVTRLVDDVQKAGLTMDGYLKSKNTTMEELREKMAKELEETYKVEFILNEIAETEKIEVDPKELEAMLDNVKDEKEREMAVKNMRFYAMVMRKQKVLDFLYNL